MNYVTGPLKEPPIKAALKLSEDKAARAHAKAIAAAKAEKKTADATAARAHAAKDAETASTSQAKGIFIQLPGLDALTAKVDTVADASVKLVDTVNDH